MVKKTPLQDKKKTFISSPTPVKPFLVSPLFSLFFSSVSLNTVFPLGMSLLSLLLSFFKKWLMLRSSPSVPECFSAHYFFPCCPLKCNYCGGCHQVGRGSKYINKYIVVEKKWGKNRRRSEE